MAYFRNLLVFSISLLLNVEALSQDSNSSEVKRYFKCYKLLVKKTPPIDGVLTSIQSGLLSGTQACIDLINRALLESDGEVKKVDNLHDPVGKQVLQTFHKLHRQWFPLELIDGRKDAKVYDLYDPQSMAYNLTNTLLRPNIPFKDIFMGSSVYRAIRKNNSPLDRRSYSVVPYIGPWRSKQLVRNVRYVYQLNLEFKDQQIWDPLYPIELGELVGVKVQPPENLPLAVLSKLSLSKRGNPFANSIEGFESAELKRKNFIKAVTNDVDVLEERDYFDIKGSYNIHNSFGGGVLGNPVFIRIHSFLALTEPKIEHGINLPRRWSKAIVGDLMCRNLPVLLPGDVENLVLPPSAKSELPFRKGVSCMQCHATMDPMAKTIRNRFVFEGSRTTTESNKVGYPIADVVLKFKSDQVVEAPEWLDEKVESYHRTKGTGSFHYRDLENNYYNEEFESLEKLGTKLTNIIDPYACLTKRYFKFLTGVDVPLDNVATISFSSDKEKKYYEYILKLAREFKNDPYQNQIELVRKIISSKSFLNPGTEVE